MSRQPPTLAQRVAHSEGMKERYHAKRAAQTGGDFDPDLLKPVRLVAPPPQSERERRLLQRELGCLRREQAILAAGILHLENQLAS